jgi:hypothetical protein
VSPDVAICGKDLSVGGRVVVNATENPCHTAESFYTWDALRGINLDITMLIVDSILFFLALVFIETKLLARVWAWAKEHIPGYYTATAEPKELESDVAREQARVEGSDGDEDILKVKLRQMQFTTVPGRWSGSGSGSAGWRRCGSSPSGSGRASALAFSGSTEPERRPPSRC